MKYFFSLIFIVWLSSCCKQRDCLTGHITEIDLASFTSQDIDTIILRRFVTAAVYLAGYALEIALKLKICKIFKFVNGFPENKAEFNNYQNSVKSQPSFAGAINQLRDIKHHELNKLLFRCRV